MGGLETMPGWRALQAEPGERDHAIRVPDNVQYLEQLGPSRCLQGRCHRHCRGYRVEQGVLRRGWTGLYLQHHERNRARQLQRDGFRYSNRRGVYGRDQRWRQYRLLITKVLASTAYPKTQSLRRRAGTGTPSRDSSAEIRPG